MREFVLECFAELPSTVCIAVEGDVECAALVRFMRFKAEDQEWPKLVVHNLTDMGLYQLGRAKGSQMRIDASRNFRLTDFGVCSLASCRDLQSLDLSGAWRVTDDALDLIGRSFPQLRSLSIARCYRVSDVGVKHLCALSLLETLDLSRCVNVHHEETLVDLALACPNLTNVLLSGLAGLVTDNSLGALAIAGHVCVLDIEGATLVTDAAISRFRSLIELKATRCSGLTSCTSWRLSSLALLDISGASASVVALDSLAALACHSPLLSTLCLRNTAVDASGLAALSSLRLEHLDLSGCGNVDDNGVAVLLVSGGLVSLNLSGCKGVSSRGVRALLSPRLRSLTLPPNADDDLLRAIAKVCLLVEQLDTGRSPKVGDAGVVAVVKSLRRLKTLRVDETAITDITLTAIAACGRLQRLTAYSCAGTSSDGWLQVLGSERSVASVMDRDGSVWPQPPATLDAPTSKADFAPQTPIRGLWTYALAWLTGVKPDSENEWVA